MFSDDKQRAAMCAALLSQVGLAYLWGSDGKPTTEALAAERDPRLLSRGQRLVVDAALAIWRNRDGPRVGDMLRAGGDQLALVAGALKAIADGPSVVERWIEVHRAAEPREIKPMLCSGCKADTFYYEPGDTGGTGEACVECKGDVVSPTAPERQGVAA